MRSACSTLTRLFARRPAARELLQRLVAIDLSSERVPALRREGDGGRLGAGDPARAPASPASSATRSGRRRTTSAHALRRSARRRATISGSRISAAARCPRCGSRKATAPSTRISGPTTRRRDRARSLRRFRQARLRRPRRGHGRARARPEAPLRHHGGRCRRCRRRRLRVDHQGRRARSGYVTSGGFGHWVGKSLAAGYVPTELARDGEKFEIDILGEMRTAIVRLQPMFDPQGLRLRS